MLKHRRGIRRGGSRQKLFGYAVGFMVLVVLLVMPWGTLFGLSFSLRRPQPATPQHPGTIPWMVVDTHNEQPIGVVRMIAHPDSEYIGGEVLFGRLWEEGRLRTLLAVAEQAGLQHPYNALDIGANMGGHTVTIAKHFLDMRAPNKPAGKVFSYEPQRIVCQQMIANVVLNGLPNVEAECVALGHIDGLHTSLTGVHTDGESAGLRIDHMRASGRLQNFGGTQLGVGGEQVLMRTVDALAVTNVKLMKVDTEGTEPLVFWGARKTIARDRPIIWLERGARPFPWAAASALGGEERLPKEVREFDIIVHCLEQLGGYKIHELDSSTNILLVPEPQQPST